jgi:hypothetical protein
LILLAGRFCVSDHRRLLRLVREVQSQRKGVFVAAQQSPMAMVTIDLTASRFQGAAKRGCRVPDGQF